MTSTRRTCCVVNVLKCAAFSRLSPLGPAAWATIGKYWTWHKFAMSDNKIRTEGVRRLFAIRLVVMLFDERQHEACLLRIKLMFMPVSPATDMNRTLFSLLMNCILRSNIARFLFLFYFWIQFMCVCVCVYVCVCLWAVGVGVCGMCCMLTVSLWCGYGGYDVVWRWWYDVNCIIATHMFLNRHPHTRTLTSL